MQHLAEGDNLLLKNEMSSKPADTRNDLSELFAENFGANATYVETLFARFRSDPALVDESWQAYFAELVGEHVVSESRKSGNIVSPQADGDGGAGIIRNRDVAPSEPSEHDALSDVGLTDESDAQRTRAKRQDAGRGGRSFVDDVTGH